MKNIIGHINKAFESRIRLGIMSVLMVREQVDFSELKEILELTDGNLSSHISALEKLEYLSVNKSFVGKKPKTTYQITAIGKHEFGLHLQALENLIKKDF
ncbi:MAG: transcriptional regulator [Cytophagales bacterium]